MAQQDLETPNSVGPITDPEARRVCSLNGLAMAKDKYVSLLTLQKTLNQSIEEFEHERRWERFLNRGLLVSRLTSATCDAFISMASAMARAVLPQKVAEEAEGIEHVYNFAKPIANAASTAAAGGKVDLSSTAVEIAKGGVEVFVKTEGYKIVAKSTVAKVGVIKSALNKDNKGVVKTAGEYIYSLHTDIIDFEKVSGYAKNPGELTKSRALSALMKIAKSSNEYNDKLKESLDEFTENEYESEDRALGMKRQALEQAKRINNQINEFQKYINSCQEELDKSLIASR